MAGHDVTADPLPPHLRSMVDLAAEQVAADLRRYDAELSRRPRSTTEAFLGVRSVSPDLTTHEEQVISMWEAGVPSPAIARVLHYRDHSSIYSIVRALRAKGHFLMERGKGWRAPVDWPKQLDAILNRDG